jgi:hypothetical protein
MTYELINTLTTNTLGSFDSEEEARDALARFQASDARFAANLALVAFDEEGLAVDAVEVEAPEREAEVVRAYSPRRPAPA